MRRQLESLGGKLGNLANVGTFVVTLIGLIASGIIGGVGWCFHQELAQQRAEQGMSRLETKVDAIDQTLAQQRAVEQQQMSTIQRQLDGHEGRIETLERAAIDRR